MKLPRQSRVSLHVLSTQATPGAFRVRHASQELQLGELSPGTSRARHVSQKPKPRATLRMSPELSTCPGSLVPRENTSGCIPSVPRVPSAQNKSHPRNSFGVCHVSRSPHRKTPSKLLRSVPRVPKPTLKDPFETPSERATCPEARTERPSERAMC